MNAKAHEVWITNDAGDGLVKLFLMQFADGQYAAAIVRDSMRELTLSHWKDSLENSVAAIAAQLREVANQVSAFAPKAQAVMDSAEVSMHPIEASTADVIARFLIDKGNELPEGPDRERLFDLSDKIRHGDW